MPKSEVNVSSSQIRILGIGRLLSQPLQFDMFNKCCPTFQASFIFAVRIGDYLLMYTNEYLLTKTRDKYYVAFIQSHRSEAIPDCYDEVAIWLQANVKDKPTSYNFNQPRIQLF